MFNVTACAAAIATQPIWSQIGLAPSTVAIHVYDSLASTNTQVWDLMQHGAGEGTVAIALQQHRGRGQWGRQWQSPPGGLYLSMGLTPDVRADLAPQLTLCVAWGVATACRDRGIPVQLKWPNDLVIQGKKLGGILTETRIQQNRIAKAVVGIGMNWQNPVPDTGMSLTQWAAEQEEAAIASLEDVGAMVMSGALAGYRYWQQVGIEPILPKYHHLLAHLGLSLTVQEQPGRVIGVSAQGELLVQRLTESGEAVGDAIALAPGTLQLGYANPGTFSRTPAT